MKKLTVKSPSRTVWFTIGILTILIFIAKSLGNR